MSSMMNGFRSSLLTLVTLLVLYLFSFTACDNILNGGVQARYYEFTGQDDSFDYRFIAKTSDPDVILKLKEELDKPFSERTMHIHGDIARGNGNHNGDWNWHFVKNRWNVTEILVEVCDGLPGKVEENLDYWADQVGYFCPWSSRVLREIKVGKPEDDCLSGNCFLER